MKFIVLKLAFPALFCFAAMIPALSAGQDSPEYRPSIPQTWDDMRTFDLPLAQPAHSPEHVSWDYYYRVPWRGYSFRVIEISKSTRRAHEIVKIHRYRSPAVGNSFASTKYRQFRNHLPGNPEP